MYTPPAGDNVVVIFDTVFSPPAGDSVIIDFALGSSNNSGSGTISQNARKINFMIF